MGCGGECLSGMREISIIAYRSFSADLLPSRAVFDPNVDFFFGTKPIEYDTSAFYHGRLKGWCVHIE